MLHDVKDYFYFTKSEKRGIFVLSFLIVFSFFLPLLYSAVYKPDNDAEIEAMIRSGIICIPESPAGDTDTMYRRRYWEESGYKEKDNDRPNSRPNYAGYSSKVPVIELNTADSLDLLSLPGIGPYFAKAIIRYREKLGGYLSVNQLLEIYGMDQQKLERIKLNLRIDTTGFRKFAVNTADFKTIMRHPYCNYQIAKALVKFRQQYGLITRFDELKKSGIFPDTLYIRILPYLSLD